MTHEEYIAKFNSFHRQTKIIGILCLTMIFGEVILFCFCFAKLEEINLAWFPLTNKNELPTILLLIIIFLPLFTFIQWKIWGSKKTKLQCPHCLNKITHPLSQQLAIAAQRCCFCGEKLFNEIQPAFLPENSFENISLVPGFPTRSEFSTPISQEKRFKAGVKHAETLSIHWGLIVLCAGMVWLAIHYQNSCYFKAYIAIAILCVLVAITDGSRFFLPTLRKWSKKNPSYCPHCQSPMWSTFAKSIILATGSCYYCGKTLWQMDTIKNNTINRHRFHESIYTLQQRRERTIRWCFFLFFILIAVFPWNYRQLEPYTKHRLYIISWIAGLILFLIGCFYYVRRSSPKFRCPHCNNILEEKISRSVAVATGSCGFCGKPIPVIDKCN